MLKKELCWKASEMRSLVKQTDDDEVMEVFCLEL